MKKIKRLLAMLLTLILCMGELSSTGLKVFAADEKTITGLGTGAITDPVEPANATDAWSGSYVVYGKGVYHSGGFSYYEHIKYRVLDIDSNDFGVDGGSILLDCDASIRSDHGYEFPSDWKYSSLRSMLNSDWFLSERFNSAEISAIASSTKAAASEKDGIGYDSSGFCELSGDKLFLLD